MDSVNNNSNIIVGIDIGTTKIVVLVGRENEFGKFEPLGVGYAPSKGVERGVVANVIETIDSIKAAIKSAEKSSNVTIGEAYVGIAGMHIQSNQHRGQMIRSNLEEEITQQDIDKLREDMHNLALVPGHEIIHVIPQEYIIDDDPKIQNPIGRRGIKLEADFHVITGKTESAKSIYRCVEKAGVAVKGLVLEPIASSKSVLVKEELEAGVALVDIGGGTTDVAIFENNIIRHTAVIPLGGNIISEDIKYACKILFDQAEKLKKKFGHAIVSEADANSIIGIPGLRGGTAKEISKKKLAYVIQSRLEEIFSQVEYQIKMSGFQNKLICGIVVTGGGSMLKHVKNFIELKCKKQARIGIPTENLQSDRVHFDELTSPVFATAVGLGLHGLSSNVIKSVKHGDIKMATSPENKTFLESKDDNKSIKFLERIFTSGQKFFED